MVYAHVINGLVRDCSLWEREPDVRVRGSYAPAVLHDVTGVGVGPDWRLVDGEWVAPEEPMG